MAMGKSYKVWQKLSPQGPYSVLLEQRNRDESLLFESLVVAALGIYNLNKFCSKLLTQYQFHALPRMKSSRNSTKNCSMPLDALECYRLILVG